MITLTISYQEIGCQIKINNKEQIRCAKFAPLSWYMIWKPHGFEPVDMLVFIADIPRAVQRVGSDYITGFLGS